MRIEGSSRRSASQSVSASSSGCAKSVCAAMAAAIIRGVNTPPRSSRVVRPTADVSRDTPAPITIGGREFRWGERTYVMGIVNVTPDSFSGDGLLAARGSPASAIATAVEQARRMVAEGADVIDVGGESTRPGHEGVAAEDEAARVVPV